MSVVDPFATQGQWLVVTASGAVHLLDSRDAAGPVTVTRLANRFAPSAAYPFAALRRDGAPVVVVAVQHLNAEQQFVNGIVVGADAWLMLEPLGPGADVTMRRTTPVVRIDPVPDTPDPPNEETPDG